MITFSTQQDSVQEVRLIIKKKCINGYLIIKYKVTNVTS